MITTEFGELNVLMQNIISEYRGVVRHVLEESEMKLIDDDIKKMLSIFIEPRTGRVELDDVAFRDAKEKNYLDVFFSTYTGIFDSFIESRIFSTLKNILVSKSNGIIRSFALEVGRKSGIYPKPRVKELEEKEKEEI